MIPVVSSESELRWKRFAYVGDEDCTGLRNGGWESSFKTGKMGTVLRTQIARWEIDEA